MNVFVEKKWFQLLLLLLAASFSVAISIFGLYGLYTIGIILGAYGVIKLLTYLKKWNNIFLCTVIGIPYDVLLKYRIDVGPMPLNALDFIMVFVILFLFNKENRQVSFRPISRYVITMGILIIYGLFMGLIFHNPASLLIRETRFFVYFLILSISTYIHIQRFGYKDVTNTVIIGSVIASLFQLSRVTQYDGNIGDLRNIHVMINIVPIGITLLLVQAKHELANKILMRWKYVLIIIMLSAVIISQTRGVWIELMLMQVWVFLFSRGERLSFLKQWSIVLLILGLLAAVGTMFIDVGGTFDKLQQRLLTLKNPLAQESGNTINFRWLDMQSQFNYVRDSGYMFTGYGFGSVMQDITYTGQAGYAQTLDTDYTENSYLFYLWKLGVWGPLIPILLFIKNGLAMILKSKDPVSVIFGSSLLAMAATTAFSGAYGPGQNLIICGSIVGLSLYLKHKRA